MPRLFLCFENYFKTIYAKPEHLCSRYSSETAFLFNSNTPVQKLDSAINRINHYPLDKY